MWARAVSTRLPTRASGTGSIRELTCPLPPGFTQPASHAHRKHNPDIRNISNEPGAVKMKSDVPDAKPTINQAAESRRP